jgi:hypothetical protein
MINVTISNEKNYFKGTHFIIPSTNNTVFTDDDLQKRRQAESLVMQLSLLRIYFLPDCMPLV